VALKPLTIRAEAGACINVTLRNRLPDVAPDLASYTTTKWIVKRDRGQPGQGAVPFENNLIRPSSHVGIHPQLVEYDVTRGDGTNVGQNPTQTVPPGGTTTYTWYAGDIAAARRQRDRLTGVPAGPVELAANPVEFGVVNLQPADKIKQGQKGMIGTLIIEPEGSSWIEDGGDSLSATVTKPNGETFRDHVVMFQKGVNMRYADGSPIKVLGNAEGEVGPEDSSNYAINYRAEPLWFRFGIAPEAPFGRGGGGGLTGHGEIANADKAFSNDLTGGEDPVSPVFLSAAGQETRMRVAVPWSVGRGIVFTLNGHSFDRNPYLEGAVPSQTIGENPTGLRANTIEGIMAGSHHNVVVTAGGEGAVPGDYLLRDQASKGVTHGLWGILRVE
jgi:hypothetical protein